MEPTTAQRGQSLHYTQPQTEAGSATIGGRRRITMKPVIGITPSAQLDTLAHGTFLRYCMSAPYVRAIETAGGVPIILPPQRDSIDDLLTVIDGLLLSGGPDVDPVRYGDD